MLEFFNRGEELVVLTTNKKEIVFNTKSDTVLLDNYDVSYPWEYEKSWILLEVKDYESKLFYNFLVEWNHLLIVPSDNFEFKEEILSFFWDVDILYIFWSKNSVKVFENIESKIVIPYWEWKDLFLSTLWQHIEEIPVYKLKSELPIENTEFVNLKN